uniref:Uncharacterized protein n=1 Tax=Tanacetum cinerariifolium TaxID=118510 RepID=A0A6L2NVZ5_TANCI|nr:hypothetical protein [Tanacetum cinerariifolium]
MVSFYFLDIGSCTMVSLCSQTLDIVSRNVLTFRITSSFVIVIVVMIAVIGLERSQLVRLYPIVDKPSTLLPLISYLAQPPARFRPPATAFHHQPQRHHHDATARLPPPPHITIEATPTLAASSSLQHHHRIHLYHLHATTSIPTSSSSPSPPTSTELHHHHHVHQPPDTLRVRFVGVGTDLGALGLTEISYNAHKGALGLPATIKVRSVLVKAPLGCVWFLAAPHRVHLAVIKAQGVMVASTTPISTDSAQRSFEDMIDIGVDIIYLEPVTTVAFPAASVEKLTALRFRVDITEAENASLRTRIETNKAFKKITRNHERLARIWIEHQLAAVQESHRQD